MSTSSRRLPATRPARVLTLALWLAATDCGSRASSTDAAPDAHADERGDDARAPDADAPDTTSDDSVADVRDATSDASADRPTHTDGATTDGTRGAPCWEDNDCHLGPASFLLCQAPGQSFGCPICYTPPNACATDQQCAATNAGTICEPAACTCHGEKTCVAGCASNAGCAPGFACGADHRCAATPCSADVVCPTDFTCVPGAGCRRKGCARDDECSFACVKGACYDHPGACTEPTA